MEISNFNNIAIIGKSNIGKSKMIKELAYSIATDTNIEYKVVLIDFMDEFKSIETMPYINESHVETRFYRYDLNNFNIKAWSENISKSRNIIFIVDNIDLMYEKRNENPKVEQILELLNSVADIGKPLNIHYIISSTGYKEYLDKYIMSKILDKEIKYYVLFKQPMRNFKFFIEKFKLSATDINKFDNLEYGRYMLITSKEK